MRDTGSKATKVLLAKWLSDLVNQLNTLARLDQQTMDA